MPRLFKASVISAGRLSQLEERMHAYYTSVPDYPAFKKPSHHPVEWRHLQAELRRRSENSSQTLSVLEFGAGRSGFPIWLRQQMSSEPINEVMIACQDVTTINKTYLQGVSDQVIIGSLSEAVNPPESFDLIFSTHCFEHVARPQELLRACTNLLKPGGSLLLFAPRYDFPFYLSPSSTNLMLPQRFLLGIRLLWIRWLTKICGEPAFLIDTDPACLGRPFKRDADAIHWVSRNDLHLWALRNGLNPSDLDISPRAAPLSKQWLIDRFGKLAVCIRKPLISS